jgi:L-malate glycosyltransferase
MKLGVAGPISIAHLRDYLSDSDRQRPRLPSGLGGTPVCHLVKAFLDKGWPVTVFTLDYDVTNELILTGPLLKLCIGPYRAQHRARDFFRVERHYLSTAIQREMPDLIHAHWTYEFALAALETGIPTIVTAHDAPFRVLRYDPSPYRLVRLLMAFAVARTAPFMTAVSPHTAAHFRRFLRHPASITVIPNGLPLQMFEVHRNSERTSDSILTCATVLNGWGKLKNGAAALRAFAIIRLVHSQSRLLMFGSEFGQFDKAHNWASRRNLASGVHFIGSLRNPDLLQRLQSEVDIIVHPSLEEACCQAILEAMALGKPVIGGQRSGGVPYALNYGKAGILTDVHSPKQIAAAVLSLTNNYERRMKLAALARHFAFTTFNINVVASAYESTYHAMRRQQYHASTISSK